MPEYLAPGVYVEEVSYRSKSIEGVSTSTAAFIGPTRYGPTDMVPDLITSLADFERTYGDGQQLEFTDENGETAVMDNYMWHATRAFFEEGGKRLYVQRVFTPTYTTRGGVNTEVESRASTTIGEPQSDIQIKARFSGKAGKCRVTLTVFKGKNILDELEPTAELKKPVIRSLRNRDLVWIGDVSSPYDVFPSNDNLYIAIYNEDEQEWTFESSTQSPLLKLSTLNPDPISGHRVHVITLGVTVETSAGIVGSWKDLAIDPNHKRAGQGDSIFDLFAKNPHNAALARTLPIIIERGDDIKTGLDVLTTIGNEIRDFSTRLNGDKAIDQPISVTFSLTDGKDGDRPRIAAYQGKDATGLCYKTGLLALEDIDDISMIAAPGHTFIDLCVAAGPTSDVGYGTESRAITNLLIGHSERMRYRVTILDSRNSQSIADIRAAKAKLDSEYAALYYPWVTILDPITNTEKNMPPCGFVAGIYARNDVERGVYKAPANEVVRLALSFETVLNKSQQDVLNPEGINCFRYFEGRGNRLWGARTISSDPEWKYVNVRRYFAYLEHSIDKGTQWAVFEPNGESLWSNVRRTIEDFLINEWVSGALLGARAEEAFFVRCDRSTMTQNDLDNGRLVCKIGVAPLKPAEFVIFRIGQWTSDRKV